MNLRISGKHMDIGDAFRGRIEGRIGEAIAKYFDGNYSGQVVMEKTGSHFDSDCLIRLDTGVSLHAGGHAPEPLLAFDAAAERLEKRLRRYKRKLKSHKASGDGAVVEVPYRIVAFDENDEEEMADDYAPVVIAESTVTLSTMTVAGAVMELDIKDDPVFVFRNAANSQVNIVYRRADGNIGWIDPSTAVRPHG